MSEKAANKELPIGYFPVRITVGAGLVERFIEEAEQRHKIAIIQPSRPVGELYEDAVVAVPFPDKEMLRVDFNIFASEMETEHGVTTDFLMESAIGE